MVLICAFYTVFVIPHDNKRSARAVCETARAVLHEPDTTLLTRWPMLADEAAIYLPLDAGSRPGHRVVMVFDDSGSVKLRRSAGKFGRDFPGPVPFAAGEVDEKYFAAWNDWMDGAVVTGARRVDVPEMPGDSPWKLFVMTVDRRRYAIVDARR